MKKCSVYLDYVNSDTFDENNTKEMLDILAHTEHCTDCSFDRRVREKLLAELAEYPQPDYPENLHEIALSGDFDNKAESNDKPDYISYFFMNLLKPMEFAIPMASVLILVFMIQINSAPANNNEITNNNLSNSSVKKLKIAEASENINENGLQKVSSDEVKEFLAKLDEFQRLHPESSSIPNTYSPNVRLVGSR